MISYFCPKCKYKLPEQVTNCPACNAVISNQNNDTNMKMYDVEYGQRPKIKKKEKQKFKLNSSYILIIIVITLIILLIIYLISLF